MHHKRKKSRNQRAGCKMCKPWKANGVSKESVQGESHSDHIRRSTATMALMFDTLPNEEIQDFEDPDYHIEDLDDLENFDLRIKHVEKLRKLQKIRESKDKK